MTKPRTDHKAILTRVEQIVNLLRTRHVRKGWKMDEDGAACTGDTSKALLSRMRIRTPPNSPKRVTLSGHTLNRSIGSSTAIRAA
jgi:hypothetical protein